jgi:nucleoside-diphosphate-sugar epimerase
MAKQVLVTGASGFVGSHLSEALEMRGHSVFAMTRHPDAYTGARLADFRRRQRTLQSPVSTG